LPDEFHAPCRGDLDASSLPDRARRIRSIQSPCGAARCRSRTPAGAETFRERIHRGFVADRDRDVREPELLDFVSHASTSVRVMISSRAPESKARKRDANPFARILVARAHARAEY
jgi:hypothetical protein